MRGELCEEKEMDQENILHILHDNNRSSINIM